MNGKNAPFRSILALLSAFFHLIALPGIIEAQGNHEAAIEYADEYLHIPSQEGQRNKRPSILPTGFSVGEYAQFAYAYADTPPAKTDFIADDSMTLSDLDEIMADAVPISELILNSQENKFIKGFIDGIRERYPLGDDNTLAFVNIGKDALVFVAGIGFTIVLTGVFSTLAAMGAAAAGTVVIAVFIAGIATALVIKLGSIIKDALSGKAYEAGKEFFDFSRELVLFIAGAKTGNAFSGFAAKQSVKLARFLTEKIPAFANVLRDKINPVCQAAIGWCKDMPHRYRLWKNGQEVNELSLYVEREGFTTLSRLESTYAKSPNEICRMELTENPEYSRLRFLSENRYIRSAQEAENHLRVRGFEAEEGGRYIKRQPNDNLYTAPEVQEAPKSLNLGKNAIRIKVDFEQVQTRHVSVGALRRGYNDMSANSGPYESAWFEAYYVEPTRDPLFVTMRHVRARELIRPRDQAVDYLTDSGYKLVESDMYLANSEGKEILWKKKISPVTEEYIRIAGSKEAFERGTGEAATAELRLRPDGTVDKVTFDNIYKDEIFIPIDLVTEARMQRDWNTVNPSSAPRVVEANHEYLRMTYLRGRNLLKFKEGELKLNPGAWERFVERVFRYHESGRVYNDFLDYMSYENGVLKVIPKNNIIVRDGELYLLDFGIAGEARVGKAYDFEMDIDCLWYLQQYLIQILKVKTVRPHPKLPTPADVLEVQGEMVLNN